MARKSRGPSRGDLVGLAESELLRQLAGCGPILLPVALVVAHPDDETIAAGGTMARFLNLTLIHVTNGASNDQEELGKLGFATREDYAATRQRELDSALKASGATPVRRVCYGIPDRETAARLDEIIDRLAADFITVDAVMTHPYEGGHIDHDACARACDSALDRLRALTGRAPGCIEFASYHRSGGYVRTGAFWPDPGTREIILRLDEAAVRRRDAALRCFVSQADNMSYFGVLSERFRSRPIYDFSAPPPPEMASLGL